MGPTTMERTVIEPTTMETTAIEPTTLITIEYLANILRSQMMFACCLAISFCQMSSRAVFLHVPVRLARAHKIQVNHADSKDSKNAAPTKNQKWSIFVAFACTLWFLVQAPPPKDIFAQPTCKPITNFARKSITTQVTCTSFDTSPFKLAKFAANTLTGSRVATEPQQCPLHNHERAEKKHYPRTPPPPPFGQDLCNSRRGLTAVKDGLMDAL